MAVADDLELLQRLFRELQVEWEKFFGGVEKKPPTDLKTKVEGLIRRYAYSEIRNNTERFRYQTLTARYNTFNELWNKRVRALEEGRVPGLHQARTARLVIPPPPESAPATTPAPAAPAFRLERSEDSAVVRALFDEYVEARKQTGEKGGVNFESFHKVVKEQARRILVEKGAQAVDFRFEFKEGKVTLKAKPVK